MKIRIGTGRRRRPLSRILFALVVVVFIPLAFVWLVNQQWLLTHVLRTVNFKSPTQIALTKLTWNPFTSTIRLEGLGIHHIPDGRDGWIKSAKLSYKPLGLLRGKFIISEFGIDEVNIVLPPKPKELEKKKKGRRRLNVGRLLLLHSLIIEDAKVNQFSVAFGKDATFRADSLSWSLKPRFTGDTTLSLGGNKIFLHKATKPVLSADEISLKTSTSLSRWTSDFPYLNALEGSIIALNAMLQGLDIDRLEAAMRYENERVDLSDLEVTIGGNKLTGVAIADIGAQAFSLNVDIPKPIRLPYLGKEITTLDTSGDLSGHIEVEGVGFVPRQSKGRGHVALLHRFTQSPDYPVEVTSNFSWRDGAIDLSDSNAEVSGSVITIDGVIDVIKKRMSIAAQGEEFPIEAVFETFRNPHLRRIYGRTDFNAKAEGWGRQFSIEATGTTSEGGFKPIVGERIETELAVTYDKLDFHWKLFQEDRLTGTADLIVHLGARGADGKRLKTLDLNARLDQHSLEPSFPGFKLTGTAGGEITLKGPHDRFTGDAKGEVVNGSWLGIPIDFASTDIDLTRYKITFKNAVVQPRSVVKKPFVAPLVMDLSDGKFRLHGEPFAGLDLDLTYLYEPKRVQIQNISYAPPTRPSERLEVRGSVVSGGAIGLTAGGHFDLSLIEPVHALVREARGPVDLQLRVGGTTSSPALYGTMTFGGSFLSPRPIRLVLDRLTGTMRFEGHRVHFVDFTGLIEDGEFTLSGWLEHHDFKLSSANLALKGKELSFRTALNTFRMEFDGDLTLTGPFPHPLLAGDINILDGRYTKDFILLEQIGGKGKRVEAEEEAAIVFDPRLNLTVHNSGDLLIRNNVGDIGLQADIAVTGRRSRPEIQGSVNVREGKINYLGLKFEITRGFVEFRGPYAKPYLEVEAERELRLYNITMRLYGYTDNLALDLEGTSPSGPLEKRDVVSLLAFGITEQERREFESTRTGSQIGISVAAQQVGQMLERPITQATPFDIFRVEAAEQETYADEPGKIATRLRVGKQVTDRLSFDFATDIDTKDAEQTVTTEYLITDNILIKGSRSSEGKYEGNFGLRFRLR